MRKRLILLFILFTIFNAGAQNRIIDSLKQLLFVAKESTNKAEILISLRASYNRSLPNTAEFYAKQVLADEIKIKDNGNGILQKVVDKIFQPFFTTKPTGQGTGLGLSLSYDILKAHGGEIKVETKEGEGSEFIIQLPISV
jgi:signal transduction histidine kinase